jgi:hypothetical protein
VRCVAVGERHGARLFFVRSRRVRCRPALFAQPRTLE